MAVFQFRIFSTDAAYIAQTGHHPGADLFHKRDRHFQGMSGIIQRVTKRNDP